MIPRLRIPLSRLRCVPIHSSLSASYSRFCPSSLRFAYACHKRLYSTSSSSASSSATDPPRSLPKITETTHGRTRIYFHDPKSQKLKWEWEDVMNKKGHGFGIGWMTQSFRATFLPVGYPASVHPTYLRFHIWKAIETTLGSSIAVLCSQAMLHSLGLGTLSIISDIDIRFNLLKRMWKLRDVVFLY
ncbi:hypothetical protein BKA69DRAFT_688668 [Paraphysoderma sedebokerense]|nr:hypothetical protein BKA69DRAFT_688668 [Paraphysoderma sedebokerense]